MRAEPVASPDYLTVLSEIKTPIHPAQVLALRAINNDLITPCWDIGRLIVERQHGATWGQSVVAKLAAENLVSPVNSL